MRISDWSSDVCSSDLVRPDLVQRLQDTAEVCDGNRYQPDLVMDAERLQVTERRGLRIPGRTVDLITLAKQQLRQIGTILATDTTDQCTSHLGKIGRAHV